MLTHSTIQVSNSLTRCIILPALSVQSSAMPPKASLTNRYNARRMSPVLATVQPTVVFDGTGGEPTQFGWTAASVASILMVVFLGFLAAH